MLSVVSDFEDIVVASGAYGVDDKVGGHDPAPRAGVKVLADARDVDGVLNLLTLLEMSGVTI